MNKQFFYTPEGIALAYILTIWAIFWKALALWRSARSGQRYWFILILIVNLLGVLEIIYLFQFAKDKITVRDLRNYFTKENLENFKIGRWKRS